MNYRISLLQQLKRLIIGMHEEKTDMIQGSYDVPAMFRFTDLCKIMTDSHLMSN